MRLENWLLFITVATTFEGKIGHFDKMCPFFMDFKESVATQHFNTFMTTTRKLFNLISQKLSVTNL